jgi:hypothetical protein
MSYRCQFFFDFINVNDEDIIYLVLLQIFIMIMNLDLTLRQYYYASEKELWIATEDCEFNALEALNVVNIPQDRIIYQ